MFFHFVLELSVLLNGFSDFVNAKTFVLSYCRNRNRLIKATYEDLCLIIESEPGDSLDLACHFCNEADNGKAKVWTKLNYLRNEMPQEIDFLKESRYHLQTDNSLLINTIEENDSGLYSCQENINQKDSENAYAYYIDVVFVELYDQGNTENWKAYVEKFITPMKEKFLQSENEEYIYLRNILGIQMNVVSEWEKQQACDGCTRISKRKAFCRLRPTHKEKMDLENITKEMLAIKKFLSIYQLSCHSLQLSDLFPKIAQDLSNIPNFLIVSQCKGQCKVSSGIHQAKYHDYYNLKEYAHLILTCPETTASSQVVWLKNGEQLKARNNNSSKIEVDIFGTLSLSGIAWSDEGNYSCFVDKVHMQDVIIKIKPSFSDNTEFFWQNVCIGIILWFNFILFCAGLTIKCRRRHQYKTLDEILEEEELERKTNKRKCLKKNSIINQKNDK